MWVNACSSSWYLTVKPDQQHVVRYQGLCPPRPRVLPISGNRHRLDELKNRCPSPPTILVALPSRCVLSWSCSGPCYFCWSRFSPVRYPLELVSAQQWARQAAPYSTVEKGVVSLGQTPAFLESYLRLAGQSCTLNRKFFLMPDHVSRWSLLRKTGTFHQFCNISFCTE